MAKKTSIGAMRTKIKFYCVEITPNDNAVPQEIKTPVFASFVWCNWQNSHGKQVYEDLSLNLNEPATITMRFSSLINRKMVVQLENDSENLYEIISLDNVQQRNKWLEIKVQRRVNAK